LIPVNRAGKQRSPTHFPAAVPALGRHRTGIATIFDRSKDRDAA